MGTMCFHLARRLLERKVSQAIFIHLFQKSQFLQIFIHFLAYACEFALDLLDFLLNRSDIDFRFRFEGVHIPGNIQVELIFFEFI